MIFSKIKKINVNLRPFVSVCLLATILLSSVDAFSKEDRFVTIGTGGQTGVYYVVGQSICRLVNKETKENGIKCTAPSTGGSVANLNAIREGSMDLGVVQSDWQYHAYNGTDKFIDKGDFKELRSLFSLYSESFTVMARADAGIKSFEDLKGKRVNIGNPGSGERGTLEVLMKQKGWTKDDFLLASELKTSEQSRALCDNKIDASVLSAGHPNGMVNEASATCEVTLVPVKGPEISKLVKDNSYYTLATIPGGLYKGNDKDVNTFGVAATFVTTSKLDDDTAYEVVKAVFDNIDRFKRLHPAFRHLNPQDMIKNGLSAPLHEGAIRYYKERGWM